MVLAPHPLDGPFIDFDATRGRHKLMNAKPTSSRQVSTLKTDSHGTLLRHVNEVEKLGNCVGPSIY